MDHCCRRSSRSGKVGKVFLSNFPRLGFLFFGSLPMYDGLLTKLLKYTCTILDFTSVWFSINNRCYILIVDRVISKVRLRQILRSITNLYP